MSLSRAALLRRHQGHIQLLIWPLSQTITGRNRAVNNVVFYVYYFYNRQRWRALLVNVNLPTYLQVVVNKTTKSRAHAKGKRSIPYLYLVTVSTRAYSITTEQLP